MLVVSSGFANKPADLHSAASGNIASKPSVPSKNKDVNCLILDKFFLKNGDLKKIKKEKYFYTIKNKKDFKKYSNSNLIFENL